MVLPWAAVAVAGGVVLVAGVVGSMLVGDEEEVTGGETGADPEEAPAEAPGGDGHGSPDDAVAPTAPSPGGAEESRGEPETEPIAVREPDDKQTSRRGANAKTQRRCSECGRFAMKGSQYCRHHQPEGGAA